MKRLLPTAAFSIIATLPLSASANDIVDFLRAISGPSRYAHDHRASAIHSARHHQVYDRRFVNPHGVSDSRFSRRVPQAPSRLGRSGLSFSVSLGNTPGVSIPRSLPAPPPPAVVLPPAPAFGTFGHLPHELGQIVTCNVPICRHVVVRNACRMAPNAVPAVVAVRDPALGRFRHCVERLAYVEVMVPPCPLRRAKVSPCKTRVRLDYGRYEVTIVSRNGVIEITYS